MITGFDHYTVRAANLEASCRFYAEVLGLDVQPRPGASVPAAIASINGVQVVHLFQATSDQDARFGPSEPVDVESPPWRTGRLQHVGFWARDVEGMRARLEANGVRYRERALSEKHQFVVYDPDGVEIEVNFPLV